MITSEGFALVGGNNNLSGTYHGAPEVVAVPARYPAATPGEQQYDEYETHVFELVDGLIAGILVYWNDAAPADDFFA